MWRCTAFICKRQPSVTRAQLRARLLNVLICADQLAFSLLTLGSSAPDETMSAAAYRLEQAGRWPGRIFRPLIDALFWFDPTHCKTSYESEINDTQRGY